MRVSSAKAEHGRHEVGRDPVGQPLDGRLGTLRFLDDADNLCERRIFAHASGTEAEGAVLVHRAAHDLVAHLLFHRQAFAGQHRFVHRGSAVLDDAVHGNAFAGTHRDEVARRHVLDGNVLLHAVADDPGRAGLQTDQFLDGRRRPAFRPGFQQLAEQNQRDNDGRRFKVEVMNAEAVAPEQHDDAVKIRGRRAQHHQSRHVGRAVAQVVPGVTIKLAAGEKLHRRGQSQLHPAVVQPAPDAFPPAEQHGDHGQQQGRREDGRHSEPQRLAPNFRLAGLLFHVDGVVLVRGVGFVTDVLHPFRHLGHAGRAGAST